MFTTTLFGVHDTKMTRVFVMQYEIMAIERVVEYMLKVHKSPSHRLPRIAWEVSKMIQNTCYKSKILYFNWMQDMEIWFGRWDATHLLHDTSLDSSINEAYL